jgi:hypothetical protein
MRVRSLHEPITYGFLLTVIVRTYALEGRRADPVNLFHVALLLSR